MEVAKRLLEIEAVALQPNDPFTWSSGIKSPIYCDNRLTLSYPEVRSFIADKLSMMVKEKFPEAEMIAGTATAGIPHAAFVSERLTLPMCYVRGSAKSHGKGKQIEGKILKGQKVVVIEDLISTGGSSLNAVQTLQKEGTDVLGVIAIFSYNLEKANQAFAEANIPYYSLSNFDSLLKVAQKQETIAEKDVDRLMLWKQDPTNEHIWL
ncbi:orotate phosphoribosyltransferase [Bacillus carboniphilus]|uniref:Orotate phosphoribosyltransferase n=1 Tax=Bacillus carboniphilus TaxID=86663 RepID=A0ABY9JW18_9BACI|nr:orotate phosphoribosyltransferase [Bacillus carboniphilus]WLR43596.1 orotate phosphoribosyltransferase [Bacillus carboniphilus]